MLGLLAFVYKKIVVARNRRFDGGDGVHDLGARSISIGNITSGGTGKTPLVIKAAEILAGRGKRVCVLTRGYGRRNEKERVLVSDGKTVLSDAAIAGDEAVETARRLLGKAIIVADADRVAAAAWARERFGVNVFVLDDGYQHRQAKRDVDIVCIDALDPFGGSKMLPAGRLREPLEHLSRASAIVITHVDCLAPATRGKQIADLKAEIAKFTSAPLFTTSTAMKGLVDLRSIAGADVGNDHSAIANRKAFAFCGLASPAVFFEQLKRDNFEIAAERAFADHYKYSQADVEKIRKQATDAGAAFLLTTAKDAAKLTAFNVEMPCFVLEVKVVIDDEEGFAALL